MAGKKPCGECDRRLPIAIRVCECGYEFPKGKSSKLCEDCGKRCHNARKQCPCGFIFKPPVLAFKDKPIELTSDRLRPRRIRMKCQIYDESDFIYNMLPSEHSFENSHGFFDKDINDAALESIANSFSPPTTTSPGSKSKENVDVNSKQDVSKYMERLNKDTNFISNNIRTDTGKDADEYISTTTRISEPCGGLEQEPRTTPNGHNRMTNSDVMSSNVRINTTPMKCKPTPRTANASPLSHLIRGQVTKAIKTRIDTDAHTSTVVVTTSDSDSRSARTDSQSESEEENIRLSELLRMRKRSLESSCEESPGTDSRSDSGVVASTSVPLIAGLPNSPRIETKCARGGVRKRGRPRKEAINQPGRPRKHSSPNIPPLGRGKKLLKKISETTLGNSVNQDFKGGSASSLLNGDIKAASSSRCTYTSNDKCVKVTSPTLIPVTNFNGIQSTASNLNSACAPGKTTKTEIRTECASNTPTPTKRGRPKGCKDTKKRKPRQDYIGRLMERNENVDEVLKARESVPICHVGEGGHKPQTPGQRGRPSLMASDKSKHGESHGEYRMGSMNAEEIEQIERRLNKTDPWIIPNHKRELFSLILGEINHRITVQSFQTTLK